jgi:hypothetical protein
MLDHNFEPLPSKPLRRLSLGTAKSDKAKPGTKGEHFVEPWRLTDREKAAIAKALEKRKIGDAEGRRIFVGALEYELSAFRVAEARQPVEEPAPLEVDLSALRAIAGVAQDLAAKLGEIPQDQEPALLQTLEVQDEMGRGYSARYLDRLYQEVSRLAEACGLLSAELEAAQPREALPAEETSPAMLELISSLTHVFEECFEQTPTTAARGAFAATLKAVADGVGLEIPRSREVLEQVLGSE